MAKNGRKKADMKSKYIIYRMSSNTGSTTEKILLLPANTNLKRRIKFVV
jgi:hypothetical protein